MRLKVFTVVAGLCSCLLAAAGASVGQGADADGRLVVAASRVLEQNYYRAVEPVALLNSAIASLREASGLGRDVLPDIGPGTPETQAATMFQQRFERALEAHRVSQPDLAYRSTAAMLASLHDSDTYYMKPDRFAEEKRRDASTGVWAGTGVTLRRETDRAGASWIFIEDVYPGAPAQAAGLRRFDRIVEVDGKPVQRATVADTITLLRGQPGSTASVVILRGGERRSVQVVRAPIRLTPRADIIQPGILYLRVYYFGQGTGDQVRQLLRPLIAQGPVRALIVDLRGNSGGFVGEELSLAGIFAASQRVIGQVMRHAGTMPLPASGETLLSSTPMVVLTDAHTVPAMLVLGLRAARAAAIIGEKFKGIGGSGQDFALPSGGMHATTEMLLGPHGEPIQDRDVVPDTDVPLTEADMERAADTQLDAAIRAVRK
jgi:carboxyl-terminal processing protease